MPMFDYACDTCGNEFETFLHQSQTEAIVSCPNEFCSGFGSRRYVYQRPHSYSTGRILSVVYRNPDGSIGVLGDRNGIIPEGSERVEIRGAADAQRICKEMSDAEYSKFLRKQEREEQTFGAHHAQQRAELRMKMQSFSQRGQDFARAAMKQNDEAPRTKFRTNVFFDAFENNASNRDGYRGEDHRSGRK